MRAEDLQELSAEGEEVAGSERGYGVRVAKGSRVYRLLFYLLMLAMSRSVTGRRVNELNAEVFTRQIGLAERKLAGAEGFEPSPSSLTVRCPTSWTTPQRLGKTSETRAERHDSGHVSARVTQPPDACAAQSSLKIARPMGPTS